MLRGEFPDAGSQTPEALLRSYEETLAAVVESAGAETVADETGVDRETVDALAAGESPELSLEDAASILAVEEGRPDAEAVAAEARDILLLGMTTAVVDVERLSSEIDGEMEPKEIQQKVEGRRPMTIAEYARLHQSLESRAG